MRGLYVSDDRNYSYLGTRGFLRPGDYNSRILLLVDGHRVNDNVYDAAFFGREAPVPVGMIERIEFVRGPSSSIYGSSAFFGIVNVVLKHAKDIAGAAISAAGAASARAKAPSASAERQPTESKGRWAAPGSRAADIERSTILVRSGRFPARASGQRRHRVGSRWRARRRHDG